MNAMLKFQSILLLLLCIGVIARKRNIITYDGRKSLSALVINVILPFNIINSFRIELSANILKQCAVVLAVAIVTQIFYILISKVLYTKFPDNKKPVLEYATICSNAGFMGNPIVEAIYGSQGLLYASIALIPLRVAMWSAGLSLFTKTDKKSVVKKLLTHPCIIAVYIGFALMITQVNLPTFIGDTIKIVSNCNTAISMIVIGAILAEIDVKQLIEKSLLYYSAWRLVLIPLIVFLALKCLKLDTMAIGVTVLLAAMPAGSTTVMLADTYGADSKYASSCVFVSTILSMLTLPIISAIL